MVYKDQGKSSAPSNTAHKIAPAHKYVSKSTLPTFSQTYPSSSSMNNIHGGNEKLTERDIQVRNNLKF